jgi:hypothetical protein
MEVWLERANTRQRITVSRKSIPDFLLMPVLSQRPGILIGQPPGSQVPYHFQLVVNQREMQEAASRLGGEKLHVPAHIDMEAYFQMIAKIAHGFAVAILGIDGFYPYLQPMIVRRHQPNLVPYRSVFRSPSCSPRCAFPSGGLGIDRQRRRPITPLPGLLIRIPPSARV